VVFTFFISLRELRSVRAALLQESAALALGLSPDRFFWLTPTPRPPANALAALRQARDITPDRARSHYLLALGRQREFLYRRTAAVTANLVPGVDSNSVVVAVRAVMRDDETQVLRSSVSDLREATRLSPSDADAHSLLARYLADLAVIGDPTAEMARQSAERAVSLAPTDVSVLNRVFDAFSSLAMSTQDVSRRDVCRSGLLEIGHRLLAAETVPNPDVPVYWDAAGIAPEWTLSHRDVSVRVLWFLYRHYERGGRVAAAKSVLQRIEQACATPHALEPRPLLDKAEKATLANCRASLVQERARWALSEGRWADYRAMEPDRGQTFAHRAAQVEERGLWAASPGLLHIRLDDWRLRAGLTADQLTALCERLLERNDVAPASLRLAELAFREGDAAVEALRKLAKTGMLLDAPKPFGAIVNARLLMADREFAEAEKALQAVATGTPHAYAHRLAFLRATCLNELRRRSESRDLILEAIRGCPSDPDLLLAYAHEVPGNRPVVETKTGSQCLYDLLTDLTPPIRLDAEFAGGLIVLTGFGLSETPVSKATARRTMRLRLFWRIFGAVPANLTAGISVKGVPKPSTLWSDGAAFSSAGTLRFAAGQPAFGSVIVTETSVPLDLASGNLLTIELFAPSAGYALTTGEGLSAIQVLDSPRYCATRAEVVSPECPVAVVRLTPADVTLLCSVTNLLSAAGIPTAPTPSSSASLDRAFQVLLSVTNRSPDSDVLLASISPESFTVRSQSRGVTIASPTPSGLTRGLGRWLQTCVGAWQFLPDRRFVIAPSAPLFARPTWMLDAPAAQLRFGSLSFTTNSHRDGADLEAWRLGVGLTPPPLRPDFSHNLHRIYDPARFHAAHPEWFPEIAGARACPTNSDWQPCLSAPGLHQRAVEAATEFFTQHPDRPMFSLGINDSSHWCQCASCAAICPAEERPRPAGDRWWSEPYWRFVNDVAAEVARRQPHRRIGAIAYAAVSRPPSFDLASNVTVFHCEDAGALFDPRYATRATANLAAWSQRVSDLGRYGYPGLATWVFPRYCLTELAQDIRSAAEAGVRQFYMEFSHVEWIEGAMPWFAAELAWNPWRDPVALQSTFCVRSFGRAASTMDRYFNTLAEIWRGEKCGLWFDGLFDLATQADRYQPETWKRLDDLLAQARRYAEGDAAALACLDAVAAPLGFARSIARESWLLESLAEPPTDAATLRRARATLTDLQKARTERRRLLDAARSEPWGSSLQRALTIGNTLQRWDLQEDATIRSVSNWVASVENACTDQTLRPNR
jgi:hypothetical protein